LKYDDAEIYFLNFETDALPNEAGATHIGMFMAWMILHELISEEHRKYHGDALAAVKARTMTGPTFVIDQLDCKLLDGDLSEAGNAFAAAYYESQYVRDYMDTFGVDDSTADYFCSVEDSWENFDKLARIIDRRFDEWKKARTVRR
jgi:hypothetical protein